MLRTVTLCVAALLLTARADATPEREFAHVRPVHPHLATLIEEGAAQSATFRSLIERLDNTDVAALIEFDNLPSDLSGGLRFITRAGPLRLLRISIRRTLARRQMIATIAHELQHALEVAAAPEVVDEASLQAFYRRIDRDGPRAARYDTHDAQRTGDIVGLDLQAKRVEPRLPDGRVAAARGQRRTR